MRAASLIALALGLALVLAAPAGWAAGVYAIGPAPVARAAPALAIQQGLLPLDRVLPVVQRAVPGRVLDVQVAGGNYRVKVLRPNGQVAQVVVDGRTGQVLRVD
jgi:uncharacterized membrane protein YkoI